MAKYVVLIPADEAAWDATPQAEKEQVYQAHSDFAKLLASRYRGKVAGYEVWNEVGTTISAFVPADVLQDLLDAASAAIQAADPGALVRTQQVLSLLLPCGLLQLLQPSGQELILCLCL